jgi:hypothetical protein
MREKETTATAKQVGRRRTRSPGTKSTPTGDRDDFRERGLESSKVEGEAPM